MNYGMTARAAIFVFSSAILASTAQAQVQTPPSRNSYVGLGYDYYSGSGLSFSGIGLSYGHYLSRHFGFEVGAQAGSVSGVTLTNTYAEFLVRFPLGSRLSLFGDAGGAYASASASAGSSTLTISKLGYRAGGGIDYDFSSRWAIRAAYHYQYNSGSLYDASLGLLFRF